mgnify:CR=1 FL=1
MTTPWLLVAGDLTPLGGMDAANHALAGYLGSTGTREVHVVTHRAWPISRRVRRSRCMPCGAPSGATCSGARCLRARGGVSGTACGRAA